MRIYMFLVDNFDFGKCDCKGAMYIFMGESFRRLMTQTDKACAVGYRSR